MDAEEDDKSVIDYIDALELAIEKNSKPLLQNNERMEQQEQQKLWEILRLKELIMTVLNI